MKKFYSLLLLAVMCCFSFRANAHAVQVAYCVSCNGDLRIYIEHWHNSEPISSNTNMQIDITYNGNTVTQNQIPNGNIQNTTINNLPGCATQIITVGACPGNANTYNDWYYFDFTGIPAGVPVSFTIGSSPGVQASDACGMFPVSANFTIPPAAGTQPDIDVCEGQATGPVSFNGAATWSNNNTAIGLPASGTGSIPSFIPNPGQNATITYTNSCSSGTFNIYTHPVPSSSFSYAGSNPTNPNLCLGDTLKLYDNSTGWTSMFWDFGDGDTSNLQNPTHVYAAPGSYTVTQVVSNQFCSDTSITTNIVVNPYPTPSFTYNYGCPNMQTLFNNTSTIGSGTMNYQWNMPGATPNSSISQNPSASYPSAGNYNAQLIVTSNMGCTDSITQQITIPDNPIANFTVDTACYGSTTTFTDNSNVSNGTISGWNWDFGDGTGTSITQNPTYTYTTNNMFTATLIVTSDSGCTDTTSIDVYLHDLPVANFTPDTACAGNNSVFMDVTSTAVGVQTWSWDFDNDGNPDDNTQNPTYLFPGTGTYPVYLSVVDSNGCAHDTTKNVYVAAQPTADFTSTNECFGTANSFTDLSLPNGGTITNWAWDFDNNGSVDNVNQNPTNGYPAAGNYTVELLVTTQLGCVDSITKQVTVHPIPVADFSVADVCLNEVSNYYDSSSVASGNIVNWQWDFGDAAGTSVAQNPTYTYASAGTYPVTLTVTSDSGCINTYIDSATVDPLPTAAFITNNVCLNVAASFNDNSIGNGGTITNWEWDFDGDGTTDDINQNPTNLYPTYGQYNVQLIVSTAAGCADTVVQPIDIYPMPVADFTFQSQCYATPVPFTDNSVVATGAITGWAWDFGNTNTSVAQNPSENYAGEGVYTVELIVTTDNGCKDTVTYNNIEVYPTPVVDFSPTDVCLNTQTQFQDLTTVSNQYTTNNITNWSWDFGDGVGISNQQNPTYTYAQEGTYLSELVVVSNHGCTDSLTKNVTVHPLPTVSFEGPAQGCSPVCAQLVNNSAITSGTIDQWIWKFGDGATSGAQDPYYCWYNDSRTSPESYDVTLIAISNYGCVDSLVRPALVTSYPIPQASFTFNPLKTDIYDSEITFTDQSIIASDWFWELGDGSTSTNQNPIHTYADSGTYVVNLYIENVYGCRDTATKNVIIDPTFAIWIPNVFTPDGDGINDYWFSDGYGITQLQTLVFDRWGVLVFEGYQLDSKWDGTYKGKKSVQDTYVYKIKARDVFGEWHEFIGRVTLLK